MTYVILIGNTGGEIRKHRDQLRARFSMINRKEPSKGVNFERTPLWYDIIDNESIEQNVVDQDLNIQNRPVRNHRPQVRYGIDD